MPTSVTYAFEDADLDKGYTGFTVDATVTLAQIQTFGKAIEAFSDAALSDVSIKTSARVDTSTVTKGDVECERRGVVILEHSNATTKRRYQVTIPAISQTEVNGNQVGSATLTEGCTSGVRASFATLTGIPAAELFVISSKVYQSAR